ncbi:methionine synthase [Corynebacterium sp. H128]|uniref:methionine synthase n=1 Tax=unclassified Corynebacterium TaxID=2624378 RepID=UPI00309C2F3D
MHFALGPLPGTSMREAAEVIAGECSVLAIPQLPQRGVGSDAVGRTCGVLPFNVDVSPRSWRLVNRPQLVTRRVWDRLEADLDTCEEVWGSSIDTVKVQVVGPWTLGAVLELPNGHRAITDRGAMRDIREGLAHGLADHVADVRNRFRAEVLVQADEPLLGAVTSGGVTGITQWETIPAVPEPELLDCDILQLSDPLWQLRAPQILVDRTLISGSANLDGFGMMVSDGVRVGLGIAPARVDELGERPRGVAVELARLWDELALSRELLADVDVYPVGVEKLTLADAGAALRFARVVSEMLTRDAGDL